MCLTAKECGGVLTDQQRIIQSPGFPEEYQDEQICYWHIRVRLGQKIRLHFLEFDVEEDTACLADYLEVYDSYDDVSGFAGRWGSLKEKIESIHTGSSQNLIEPKQGLPRATGQYDEGQGAYRLDWVHLAGNMPNWSNKKIYKHVQ